MRCESRASIGATIAHQASNCGLARAKNMAMLGAATPKWQKLRVQLRQVRWSGQSNLLKGEDCKVSSGGELAVLRALAMKQRQPSTFGTVCAEAMQQRDERRICVAPHSVWHSLPTEMVKTPHLGL